MRVCHDLTVLRACMIDGFGWFRSADFRRSWLFFDQVDYVLPHETKGRLFYPPSVRESREYRVADLSVDGDFASRLCDAAAADAADPTFRALVVEHVPGDDLRYAALVVGSDAELARELSRRGPVDPVFAVALLLDKLLAYSVCTGAIPIAGRRYAGPLLLHKLRAWTQAQPANVLLTPRQSLSLTAFAAGLSLGFLDDEALEAVPFDTLERFKDDQKRLLRKHQLHLIEVAQRYQEMPEGDGFAERLTSLRTEAMRKRLEMEEQARDAWDAAGWSLLKKGVITGSAGLVTGLATLRGFSLADVLAAAAPTLVAGLGVVAVEGISLMEKKRTGAGGMAYLFEAERALNEP